MNLSLVLAMTLATTCFAEHAKITLDVTAKGETVTAYVDQTPPEHGKNPRPVVTVKAGESVKIQYILTNVYNTFPRP